MAPRSSRRIHFLDEVRGFAVLCMVFYHAFFSMAMLFDIPAGSALLQFFRPAEPYFAGLFIGISGIAAMLTRSNLKRGLKLLFVALAFNVVTYLLEYVGMHIRIRFGILNLLAICMVLAAPLARVIKRVPPLVTVAVSVALFVLTCHITDGWIGFRSLRYELPQSLQSLDFLFPLGIPGPGFYSADYFPLLPWMFAFFAGMGLGVWAQRGKFPAFMYNQHIRPLSFVGRHSLVIYVLHQPVIYAFFLLVEQLVHLLP